MATSGDDLPGAEPPRLLRRPAAPRPLPEPFAASELVAALHRRRAQLSGVPVSDPQPQGPDPATPSRTIGGVRAKVRAKVVNAAAGVQAQERAMTDELVRALDAVAHRLDELGSRLGDLELLVQDVVDTVSEDLVRVHEVLADKAGPADGPGGGRSGEDAQPFGGG